MKFVQGNSKYNIITDEDVIITSNKHNTGDNLKNILETYGDDIEKLKGNVKFIYKYGGVGNGKGGNGNNIVDNGSIYATLDGDKLVDGKQFILNSTNGTKHTLKLAAKGDLNGVSYTVKVNFDNKSYGSTIFLNETNSWSQEITIDLITNSSLQIEYTNMLTLNIESISIPYIIKAYNFEKIKYYSEDNKLTPYSQQGEIFRSEFEKYGLNCVSNYNAYIDGTIKYTWTFDGIKEKENILQVNSNTNGKIEKTFPTNFELTDGEHTINLDITFQASNSSTAITVPTISATFTILSDELMLTIIPSSTATKFYNDKTTVPTEDKFFRNGEPINLQLRVYQGKAQTRTGNIIYSINDGEEKNIQFQEGNYCNITIVPQLDTTGWLQLRLNYSLGSFEKTEIKYLYVNVVKTTYTWWANIENGLRDNILDIQNGNGTYYFRTPSDKKGDMPSNIIRKNSSELTSTTFTNNFDNNEYNSFIIHLGIQYSKNNDETKEFVVFDSKDTIGTDLGLRIYQNKITLNKDYECSYFLEEESLSTYNPDDVSKYHLVSIALRRICSQGTNSKYELAIYLDGVLESVYPTFLSGSINLNKISFMPGNYAINLIEFAFINSNYGNNYDADITYYYYTYLSKKRNLLINNNSLFTLMQEMAKGNIKFKNALLNLNADSVSSIIQNSQIPSLMVTTYSGNGKMKHGFGEIQIDNIFQWLNTSYEEKNEGSGDGIKDYQLNLNSVRWFTPGLSEYSLNSSAYKSENNDIDESSFFITDDPSEKSGEKFNFTLDLQGSSTMGFKGKNFTLGIKDNGNTNRKYLFSPNFSTNDTKTFLPEASFNLKADIVDSSHTNNVCMGNFINENSEKSIDTENHWFNDMISHKITSEFQRSFTKKCLTGFPIFLFLEINDETTNDISEYYLLGIYNFNLGRSSDFNLGYKDIRLSLNGWSKEEIGKEDSETYKKLTNNYKTPNNKFTIISSSNDLNYVDGFIAAEIQGNTNLWDFSQYDSSILFQGNYKSNYMFGDIKKSSSVSSTYTSNIQKMVESVANAGAFIFKEIGKKAQDIKLSKDGSGSENYYSIPGVVPSIEYQYERTSESTFVLNDKVNKALTNGEEGSYIKKLTSDSLLNCIYTDTTNGISRKFNYDSIVFYYTTCMAFGLVDSVQKNLTVKTWNAENTTNPTNVEFGSFFYDMDTCLGLANDGSETDYFCFSDYYKTLTDFDESTKTNNVKGSLILRDYFPKKNYTFINEKTNEVEWEITQNDSDKLIGYDIPSSYLFAIAKYSWGCLGGIDSSAYISTNPSQLWYNLRYGDLLSAENFVNKYFKSYTEKIDEYLWNMNYRAKYLSLYNTTNNQGEAVDTWYEIGMNMKTDTSSDNYHNIPYGYSNNNIKPLKGKRVYRVKNWLNNRIHLLDFYFNMNTDAAGNTSDSSLPETINSQIEDTRPTKITNTVNNDIVITNGIFGDSDKGINRSSAVDFTVQAEDYSPLIIKNASVFYKYILTDSETKYHINTNFTGSAASCFGGSNAWVSLDSLNTFISSLTNKTQGITINSEKLINISADEPAGGLSGTWNIKANKVKTISLTSSKFKGTLSVDKNNLNSLSDINISNTGISLDINGDGMNINTLTANNLNNAGSLNIINAESIKKISLSGNVSKATITAWETTFAINGNTLNISDLNITAKNNTVNSVLTISNNNAIKNITFKGFKEVHITNCPNLISVFCNDTTTTTYLNVVEITNTQIQSFSCPCIKLNKLIVNSCNNLSNLQLNGDISILSYLDIRNTKIDTIIWDEDEYNQKFNENNVLNLKKCNKDIELYSSNNAQIQYIQLQNEANNINENIHEFSGCLKLKRIFGNFRIKKGMFYGCKNFSIFGVKAKQWKGKEILENNIRIKHPYEILNNSKSIEYNNYPNDLESRCFTSGDFVTNAHFDNDISNCCYNTACTIFDIYYTFYIGKNIVNASQSFRNCNSTTWYDSDGSFNMKLDAEALPYYRWFWTKQNDIEAENSINKYIFYNSQNITNLNLAFYGLFTNYVRLDNDLLSPLTNLVSLSNTFIGGNLIISQNLLLSNKKIKDISYFNAKYIIGDFDPFKLTYDSLESIETLYKVTKGELGKFNKLFDSIQEATQLLVFLYNCDFLNYGNGTWVNKIPKNITKINRSINTQKAIGKYPLQLKNWFANPSIVTDINSSFMVYNTNQDLNLTYIDEYEEENTLEQEEVTMEITNSFFDNFNNLEKISNAASIGDYQINNTHISSFNGKGLNKIITGSEFPYNIFSNLTKLTTCTGFFMNTKVSDEIQNIELPGTLFIHNQNLIKLDYTFCNVKFNYNLSETNNNNFINCTKLSSIKYLFADNIPIDFNNDSEHFLYNEFDNNGTILDGSTYHKPYSSGMIPKKFFYHGGKTITKTFYGTNNEDEYNRLVENNDLITEDWKNNNSYVLTYELPNTNILNMEGCFMHCNFNEPYSNDYIAQTLEYNQNYKPFKYSYENSIWKTYKDQDKKYTAIWAYDGENINGINLSNTEIIDEIDPTNIYNKGFDWWDNVNNYLNESVDLKFFCPPDLFRYCNNSESLNIKYLFYGCGLSLSSYWNIDFSSINLYKYGIRGRIPPYLFKPINKITNINGLFKDCKLLSGYSIMNENQQYEYHYIPTTIFTYANKINNFEQTFEGLHIPSKTMLGSSNITKNFMQGITANSLNVHKMFYRCKWGGSTENNYKITISNLFTNKTISNLSDVFSQTENNSNLNPSSTWYGNINNGIVDFSDGNFNASMYNNKMYDNNTKFMRAYAGFIGNKVIFPTNQDLYESTNTLNYASSLGLTHYIN